MCVCVIPAMRCRNSGVSDLVKLVGAFPAQVVLARQDDDRLAEDVGADRTHQLLLQRRQRCLALRALAALEAAQVGRQRHGSRLLGTGSSAYWSSIRAAAGHMKNLLNFLSFGWFADMFWHVSKITQKNYTISPCCSFINITVLN